ncbi:hypothetical protein E2562_021213 [Oryza meyeriana var. granulata]|uniref:Uncharacterized protein n=1 Tax=Oryza meyeriana var. granulata TaxID=110450 RepID=A0A6G1E1A3_9ORYZ|nr:hypothetical protein E2562_021213 [Oryza meyeriana var. granulata]
MATVIRALLGCYGCGENRLLAAWCSSWLRRSHSPSSPYIYNDRWLGSVKPAHCNCRAEEEEEKVQGLEPAARRVS